jgi:hypothetical protein
VDPAYKTGTGHALDPDKGEIYFGPASKFFYLAPSPLHKKGTEMSNESNRSWFSCFGGKKEPSAGSTPTTAPPASLGERTKSMSQEMVRSPKSQDDDEFQLRLQGFDESDPEFQAMKEEKVKRRSQDMEAKRKSQEEDFQKRLQGM